MNYWFDVTSLYSWNRPVTGVTRVELECVRILLESGRHQLQFARFESQGKAFKVCEPSEIRARLAYLETLEGRPSGSLRQCLKRLLAKLPDRTQTLALEALSALILITRRFKAPNRPASLDHGEGAVFQDGDCLITVGFDLASEQFKLLLALRESIDLRVVSCCHDLIPWVRPDLTLDRIRRPFVQYIEDLVSASDHVVCNSVWTSKDLGGYLEGRSGVPSVSVIRLGSRIGPTHELPLSDSLISILNRPYILFVSTIERRKNHEVLLDAYRILLNQGDRPLPQLVLVGMRGWGAESFFQKLLLDPELANFVTLLHHVTDNELCQLYRNTLFTVYPSLYEGWGLPVAESLANGKLCIASNAASIPEIGGDLVRYCSPEDASSWAFEIHRAISDPESVAMDESTIRAAYQPPEWSETVAQIMSAAAFTKRKVHREAKPFRSH